MPDTEPSIGTREIVIAVGRPACGLAAILLLVASLRGSPAIEVPFLWFRSFRLIVCEEEPDG